METMLPLVLLGNGLFVVACGVVGVRLMLLARRTRGLPELLLGLSFLCLIAAIPAMGIAGMGRTSVAELHFELAVVALLVLLAGVVCQAAFTALTFRPGVAWARRCVVALALCEAFLVGGVVHAFLTSPGEMRSFEAAGSWIFAVRMPLLANYAWTAAESLRQYRMARRRTRLGLASEVVRNRFLLWSAVGLCASTTVGVSSVLHLRGLSPTADPLAAAVMALGGSAAATLLYLVFMPPKAYLRFLEARAAA